jgi:aspartate kinase
VNVDIIVHNKSESGALRVGFTIAATDLLRTQDILQRWIEEQGSGVQLEVECSLAKASVVGLGMQSHPGVASKLFAVLEDAGIAIQMMPTSEIKISTHAVAFEIL